MARIIKVSLALCAVALLLGVLSFKTTRAKAATVRSSTCSTWNVVPSPTPSNKGGLSGVAAITGKDVWAVGGAGNQLAGGQTLIEQWNGTQWQIVSSPNPGSFYNFLYSVSAVSANDIWAVGYYAGTSGATQTLVEQWNGTQWSVVSSPSPASVNNELFSVAAVSANDVWAVGFQATSTTQTTLIEHWNGTQWKVATSPSPGSNDVLSSVAALSASDVWAVGSTNTEGQPLIEQWNGTQWKVVTSPKSGSGSALLGVAAVSANDAWAVGYTTTNSNIETLTEQWNGTQWKVVTSVNVGMHPSFTAVTAISSGDVWAVGYKGTQTAFDKSLSEQWNGTSWSVVKSPSPGTNVTQLLGISASSANNVWAVGGYDGNTLVERYHC
jgi:erythromycin esterase-like protein